MLGVVGSMFQGSLLSKRAAQNLSGWGACECICWIDERLSEGEETSKFQEVVATFLVCNRIDRQNARTICFINARFNAEQDSLSKDN